MDLTSSVPWLSFGFLLGSGVWGCVFAVRSLLRAGAVSVGFYDV